MSVQSFGTYDDADAAATAYDIGYILFRGTRGKINRPIDDYVDQASGLLHDDLHIPEQVDQAVRRYLESGKFAHEDKVRVMERVASYWPPGKCPFL
jgi:hypothetical protein